MGIVGSVEGADDHIEPDGSEEPTTVTPPEALDRPWRHPSEVGLDERVQSDRRRGVGMAIAFVGVTGAVLLGVVGLSRMGEDDVPSLDSADASSAPLAATVQIDGGAASRVAISALVDDGQHALASLSELGPLAGTSLSVSSGEQNSSARVIAVDSDANLALLELDEPLPLDEFGHAEPTVGEDFVFTHLDHMGHLDRDTVAVESTGAQALRTNGSVAEDLVDLDGWTDHHGPLTDTEGRFAGWVFPAKGAQMYAYGAADVTAMVERMAQSG